MISDDFTVVPATAVFGADGFIGGALLAAMNRTNPFCVGITRLGGAEMPGFDLTRPNIKPLGLKKRGITHAVIASGISTVVACENNPVTSRAVNVAGTVELVRQLRSEGIKVLACSSDYVFDGHKGGYDEKSAVNPLNEYGRQKAEMEHYLLNNFGTDVLVIRLSKVFDVDFSPGDLLTGMAQELLKGIPVRAASDQYFCPTSINDVVEVVCRLLSAMPSGLLHLCAPARTSRLQLALQLADSFGVTRGLVQEILLSDLAEAFPRPLDTSMVSCRHWDFNYTFESLHDSLKRLIINGGIRNNIL